MFLTTHQNHYMTHTCNHDNIPIWPWLIYIYIYIFLLFLKTKISTVSQIHCDTGSWRNEYLNTKSTQAYGKISQPQFSQFKCQGLKRKQLLGNHIISTLKLGVISQKPLAWGHRAAWAWIAEFSVFVQNSMVPAKHSSQLCIITIKVKTLKWAFQVGKHNSGENGSLFLDRHLKTWNQICVKNVCFWVKNRKTAMQDKRGRMPV